MTLGLSLKVSLSGKNMSMLITTKEDMRTGKHPLRDLAADTMSSTTSAAAASTVCGSEGSELPMWLSRLRFLFPLGETNVLSIDNRGTIAQNLCFSSG